MPLRACPRIAMPHDTHELWDGVSIAISQKATNRLP
jgi:hypothetical protein